jgi:hypothetical protein
MSFRLILIPLFVLVSFFFQSAGCRQHEDEGRIEFGPNKKTDLVFFFNKSATETDIERFLLHDGLVIPNGTGFQDPPGMGTGFSLDQLGYQGYGLNFKPSATAEQRMAIKARIAGAQIVYKIYENVVPAEINDL